ncbi:hypothetical protein [Micromonospora endophytica]|uniref:Uncharacterized protein n=1 Tax=Micromonospora endophytica TaxID=515350 RepID=A0A2W2DG96_9ACTN|nr:hypothetical protein [Micromonospora endophytica]PZF91763.1 hypothetical protein C1I93_20805 [Micromonospora endophytica]RIW44332.1 hypothetical protein D3H59_17780 [Micromonospora endophytica]BCJ62475.1 hypothetical protein Jiend_58970 [Micromonospora endophytica]
MEQSTGFVFAVDAVTRHVNSARPDAPVRPDPPRTPRLAGARQFAAAALHRLADQIQPTPCKEGPLLNA